MKVSRETYRKLLGITAGPRKIELGFATVELTNEMQIIVEISIPFIEPGQAFKILDAYKHLWETRHSILEIEGRLTYGGSKGFTRS